MYNLEVIIFGVISKIPLGYFRRNFLVDIRHVPCFIRKYWKNDSENFFLVNSFVNKKQLREGIQLLILILPGVLSTLQKPEIAYPLKEKKP